MESTKTKISGSGLHIQFQTGVVNLISLNKDQKDTFRMAIQLHRRSSGSKTTKRRCKA
jgi:hypothetical protein